MPVRNVLDSSIPDDLIDVKGYNLVWADHPDNIKRSGVCIYYKECLPVRIKTYFKEALFLQMFHNNESLVSVIYCSPRQNKCKLDSFLANVNHFLSKINKCKPSLAVITGDFNARSSAW